MDVLFGGLAVSCTLLTLFTLFLLHLLRGLSLRVAALENVFVLLYVAVRELPGGARPESKLGELS